MKKGWNEIQDMFDRKGFNGSSICEVLLEANEIKDDRFPSEVLELFEHLNEECVNITYPKSENKWNPYMKDGNMVVPLVPANDSWVKGILRACISFQDAGTYRYVTSEHPVDGCIVIRMG